MSGEKKVIVVASTNPVKGRAALGAFKRLFPDTVFELLQVSASSGVASQPMTHKETLNGALHRAEEARNSVPAADYWVGMEGGVQENDEELMAFAWMVVKSANLIGKSCTACFFLPPEVTRLIHEGVEMGEADDIVFQMTDSKRNLGASGILTHNAIDRCSLYEHALVLALIPFVNQNLYPNNCE